MVMYFLPSLQPLANSRKLSAREQRDCEVIGKLNYSIALY